MGDETDDDWHRNFNPHHHARRENPPTSKAAAQSMKPTAGELCTTILDCLRWHGAQTFEHVAAKLALDESQVWKRLSDLKNQGLIEPAGTAIGRTGRSQTLWRAK